ncbi:MAG: ABC transporter permease [Planctomycetes bacterium]|nr:ABC transporter permease [Planctomycetota bacterium]
MYRYIIKRLLLALPTLFGITLVTFLIINLAPGDPADLQSRGVVDSQMSNRVYQQLVEYYQLDKPIHVRYGKWLKRLATFDFGTSLTAGGAEVWTKIKSRLAPTISLAILALGFSLALSIPIGVYGAARRGKWFDTISSTILYGLYSVPGYVMAVPLILLLGVQWNLLPFQGMTSPNYEQLSAAGKLADLIKHYTLITFCFSFGTWAYFSRFVRQNMLDVLGQDYILTAWAKGLCETAVLFRHGFRNTLIPMLTLAGLLLPEIIGGSVILEVMFNWPGMGRLFFESMQMRDYPTIMALTFLTACLVLLGTLIADIGYALIDPRVTYE